MNSADKINSTDFLLTSDVAHRLSVSGQTVLLWARTGKLSTIRVGNRGTRLFRLSDVERLKVKRQSRKGKG